MKKNVWLMASGAVVGALLVLTMIGLRPTPTTNAAGGLINNYQSLTTSTSILVSSTTATTLLATSTDRVYAAIVNQSGASIFLNLKANAIAKKYEGIYLAPGGSYEITFDNLYTGPITAIAVGGDASTTVAARP